MKSNSVFFPRTNPIVFERYYDNGMPPPYRSYHDAAKHEVNRDFCQPYCETDMFTFQMQENIKENFSYFTLYIVCNGIPFNLGGAISTGAYIGNNFVSSPNTQDYYELYERKNGFGVHYFQMPVLYVKNKLNNTTIKLKDGDIFYFEYSIAGRKFRSNTLVYYDLELSIMDHNNTLIIMSNPKLEGTKLIKYHHNSVFDPDFDTYFKNMHHYYQIRLPAVFSQLNQKSSKEIFQNYNGKFDLVSAIPFETIKLHLGTKDGMGIPDYLIRNLNYIFHLNDKKIDDVAYELTDQSELETEIVTGYNNRFLSIELCAKDVQESDASGGGIGSNTNISIITKYDDPSVKTSGEIFILNSSTEDMTNWRIETKVVSERSRYSFSTNISNQSFSFRSINKNLSELILYTDVNIIDRSNNNVIGTIVLELPPVTTGVCFWTICDTFYVKC
jgi:hypothetical protein